MASGPEHRGKGMIEQIKGAVKEGFGALTGNRRTEMEGKGERAKGSVREEYGNIKSQITNDDGMNDKTPR